MDALGAIGAHVKRIDLETDVEFDDVTSILVYGIYPFSFGKALKYMKDQGKKIIYDLDDALGFIEPTNPFYNNVMRDAGSEREILHYADHLTVATEGLKEYISAKTDKPITVIPNCYDSKEWQFTRPKREGIRIGFAGSSTHVDDLIEILPAIISLQKKYPEVIFIIMGFAASTFLYSDWLIQFKYVSPPEGLKSLDRLEELMKEVKYEWMPYVDFDIYPQVLTNMSLDIGLCPLKANKFNDCRSSSKAMEYTLSGALALASNVRAYATDPTSVLIDNWEETIEYYITHPLERESERLSHLAWLKENRNISSQIPMLKSVYGI